MRHVSYIKMSRLFHTAVFNVLINTRQPVGFKPCSDISLTWCKFEQWSLAITEFLMRGCHCCTLHRVWLETGILKISLTFIYMSSFRHSLRLIKCALRTDSMYLVMRKSRKSWNFCRLKNTLEHYPLASRKILTPETLSQAKRKAVRTLSIP